VRRISAVCSGQRCELGYPRRGRSRGTNFIRRPAGVRRRWGGSRIGVLLDLHTKPTVAPVATGLNPATGQLQ